MPCKDIIVVGASAGGVDALTTLVAGLPEDLPVSVFVVLHTSPESPGVFAHILDRAGPLPARYAEDRERILPGRVYVAPPDQHLVIEPGKVRLTRGPKENRFRPAVDPLFRSAAQVFGPRVVGVILTGWLDDGTAGLWAVKERGGTAVVQHPEDAFAPAMPLNAIKHVEVDHIVPLKEIAPLLLRLAETPAGEEGAYPVSDMLETEVKIAKEDKTTESSILKWGEPSIYACPECHGVLLQLKEGNGLRFRCHTGHAYAVDSLLAELTEKTEESLWGAIRALEENVLFLRHLAEHYGAHQNGPDAEALLRRANESQQRAHLVRRAVMNHENLSRSKLKSAAEEA